MEHSKLDCFIPPDKSETIRYGFMNSLSGYEHTLNYIESLDRPGKDIRSLYRSTVDWWDNDDIHVGESGTVCRFYMTANWKIKKYPVKIIKEGSLRNRQICDDERIINYTQKEALELDNGTSQFASALALLGDDTRIENPPLKLKLTYDCIKRWKENKRVSPSKDPTIRRHAEFILKYSKNPSLKFMPEHTEDLCLSLVSDGITYEDGMNMFPQAKTQESNRFHETARLMKRLENEEVLDFVDHRPAYAVLAYAKANNKKVVGIENAEAIDKSWPEFWDFLKNF